jgi:dolichol-phosphate mannosyltransferase
VVAAVTEGTRPTYSIVLPVFNERATLPELFRRLQRLLEDLDGAAEVILVDDGSADGSREEMLDLSGRDRRFKILGLSRNFGHQAAITAGLDFASGDAVIVMDADLQDPPEVVLALVEQWRKGSDVVYAVRRSRRGENRFKRLTAAAFYRLLGKLAAVQIPADTGDFRLVDRKALEAYRTMRENDRYVRGMFSWIGFRQTGVPYDRDERFAGETKYPLRKMTNFALDGILSFSNAPLRLALGVGFAVSLVSFVFGLVAVVLKLAGAFTVPGWASIVVVTSFIGGVQLVVLGVVGEYVGRIYDEVKRRPLYIVDRSTGFERQAERVERVFVWRDDDHEHEPLADD